MNPTVGIIGGGQLARMLVEAADRLRVPTHVLVNVKEDPAARVIHDGSRIHIGNLNHLDSDGVRNFTAQSQTLTFENEFLSLENLRLLQRPFRPSLRSLSIAQDKLEQKKLATKLGLATAEYRIFESVNAWETWLQECEHILGKPFLLKWSRYGYDGKGNFIVSESTLKEDTHAFMNEGILKGARLYAERMIPFTHELAIVLTRSHSGETVLYPLVITEQKNGACFKVKGPAHMWNVPSEIVSQAIRAIERIAVAIDYCGTLAVEFFLDPSGELLVNEVAPRVHNTAHYSQHACKVSQFENHMRAVAGLPLITPNPVATFGMLNILGIRKVLETTGRNCPDWISNISNPKAHLYWYDKEIQPGRKLGHINVGSDADTPQSIETQLAELENLCYGTQVKEIP